MGRIFISYRRSDSIAIAGRIFDKLTGYFSLQDVYMDIDTIPPGADFVKHINGGMAQAKVVLALIGETWLTVRSRKGRRLNDPQDFVRIELEFALAHSIPIIPVLLGSTEMPKTEELPPSLASITQFNAANVDTGRDFHLHTDRLIRNIERILRPPSSLGTTPNSENIGDLIAHHFKDCDALINVSPEHTFIRRPKTELVGFRDLINVLWEIEKQDKKHRPLIWVLDLGRQKFDDLDSRMRFLNVQAVLTRFKALKRFEEEKGAERWQWLCSRAIIVLFDPLNKGHRVQINFRPTFAAHNLSLTALDPLWLDSQNFRDLYGSNLERVQERNFSIFLRALPEGCSESNPAINDLRYFGFAQLPVTKTRGNFRAIGLELRPLPANYADAFRVACMAAAHVLGIRLLRSRHIRISGEEACEQLYYLGYSILRLDKFLETY